ncbi:hypothetical protein AHAS_Ahas09G0074900 [Arachis hypogaea]
MQKGIPKIKKKQSSRPERKAMKAPPKDKVGKPSTSLDDDDEREAVNENWAIPKLGEKGQGLGRGVADGISLKHSVEHEKIGIRS